MALDGLGAEEELGGDLAVGPALGREQRHPGLLRGQRRDGPRAGPVGTVTGARQLLRGAARPQRLAHREELPLRGPQVLARREAAPLAP
jgi:hypothetical protein